MRFIMSRPKAQFERKKHHTTMPPVTQATFFQPPQPNTSSLSDVKNKMVEQGHNAKSYEEIDDVTWSRI